MPNPVETRAPRVIRQSDAYRWEGIDIHPYKEDGTHFRDIVRHTLFRGETDLPVELRYFEVGAGGHSTLERHHHVHLVMILRGRGRVLNGDRVHDVTEHDVVYIPPLTWHQFRATEGEPLGFLCVVSAERDRPERPGPDEEALLRRDPAIAEFIRL